MKSALVTGGSRGIGRAVCLELTKMGYAVIINYLSNEEKAKEVKAMIEQQGGTAFLLPFDVADSEAVDKALLGWETDYPDYPIEILVNNAGSRKDNLMIFMDNEDWHSIIAMNLH